MAGGHQNTNYSKVCAGMAGGCKRAQNLEVSTAIAGGDKSVDLKKNRSFGMFGGYGYESIKILISMCGKGGMRSCDKNRVSGALFCGWLPNL